jgi:hypothetical protein
MVSVCLAGAKPGAFCVQIGHAAADTTGTGEVTPSAAGTASTRNGNPAAGAASTRNGNPAAGTNGPRDGNTAARAPGTRIGNTAVGVTHRTSRPILRRRICRLKSNVPACGGSFRRTL